MGSALDVETADVGDLGGTGRDLLDGDRRSRSHSTTANAETGDVVEGRDAGERTTGDGAPLAAAVAQNGDAIG